MAASHPYPTLLLLDPRLLQSTAATSDLTRAIQEIAGQLRFIVNDHTHSSLRRFDERLKGLRRVVD